MDDFKDLNELIGIARQINEGKYDLVSVEVEPESELFQIAQYFSETLKTLKTVSSAVEDTVEDLPAFEQILDHVIGDAKKASEDVLTYIDKINFNIDDIKEHMSLIDDAMENGDTSRAAGLLDRLKDKGVNGQDICFDIIASLEFQDITKQKIDKLIKVIHDLEERLATLVIKLGIKDKKLDAEILDKLKSSKDILQNQDLVDELLREFGL